MSQHQVARERAIDRFRRLLERRGQKTGISMSVLETRNNEFSIRFYTAIQSDATYLFILTIPGSDNPVLLVIPGKDLCNAAMEAGDDLSIEGGVQAYLQRYGSFDGLDEVIDIKVHKIDVTKPIVHLDYNTANNETVFHNDEPIHTSGTLVVTGVDLGKGDDQSVITEMNS